MKSLLQIFACIFFSGMLIFLSCKKSQEQLPPPQDNRKPVALAGPDQKIILPVDSVLLNGSSSSDADGTIIVYQWSKISGPAFSNILTPASSKTLVKTLVKGVYNFELTVTDNGGLSAKDTVQITVDNAGINQPPVANAGPDETITLPGNTVNLDGSLSYDPDNIITVYLWTKISGPAAFSIFPANAAKTQITNLVQGNYEFELKVTDAGGLFSKDTMQITVLPASQTGVCEPLNRPVINFSLTHVAYVPFPRLEMTAAAVGNKLLLAGGQLQTGQYPISRVDIYDFGTQSWSTANLSTPRMHMTSATAGNKIFFAGGEIPGYIGTTRVDIYDASTGVWTSANLSNPYFFVSIAVVADKVFFTGEGNGKVDIYDIAANSWSVANLSQGRGRVSTITAGNKVYFAGGWGNGNPSAVIDIYDNATGTWSVSSLKQPAAFMSSIFVNGKIYWAGGDIGYDIVNDVEITTCRVEIRDINTQSTAITHLSRSTQYYFNNSKAISYNGKIIFGRGSDIYDPQSNNWSKGNVTFESMLLVNNTLYAVDPNQVRKVVF